MAKNAKHQPAGPPATKNGGMQGPHPVKMGKTSPPPDKRKK